MIWPKQRSAWETAVDKMQSVPDGLPVRGWLASDFGLRKSPFSQYLSPHRGIDIVNRKGTPVKASGNGIVPFFEEPCFEECFTIFIRHHNQYAANNKEIAWAERAFEEPFYYLFMFSVEKTVSFKGADLSIGHASRLKSFSVIVSSQSFLPIVLSGYSFWPSPQGLPIGEFPKLPRFRLLRSQAPELYLQALSRPKRTVVLTS
jgi:hypothetical protein